MRLSAVMLVFKEQAFVEASIRAIYPVVDSICCATRHDRNFFGEPVAPDRTIERILALPDTDNKIRIVMQRDLRDLPGANAAAQLRNAAIRLDPAADYRLILDSDEIWPRATLEKAWAQVQREQWAGFRVSSVAFFGKWNYKVVEPPPGVRPIAFLKKGFWFENDRQVNWRGPARWKEYLRTGRKPKQVYFPPDLLMYHGSGVGDDARIRTKIENWDHRSGVDPDWFEKVWKNFGPQSKNFHYFENGKDLYQAVEEIPTSALPDEIRQREWPEGWILR
jgi:hypothetical protein